MSDRVTRTDRGGPTGVVANGQVGPYVLVTPAGLRTYTVAGENLVFLPPVPRSSNRTVESGHFGPSVHVFFDPQLPLPLDPSGSPRPSSRTVDGGKTVSTRKTVPSPLTVQSGSFGPRVDPSPPLLLSVVTREKDKNG